MAFSVATQRQIFPPALRHVSTIATPSGLMNDCET